ncbi:hypothetical protein VTK26DRAFT_3191 [Humicola hyalothermophila]
MGKEARASRAHSAITWCHTHAWLRNDPNYWIHSTTNMPKNYLKIPSLVEGATAAVSFPFVFQSQDCTIHTPVHQSLGCIPSTPTVPLFHRGRSSKLHDWQSKQVIVGLLCFKNVKQPICLGASWWSKGPLAVYSTTGCNALLSCPDCLPKTDIITTYRRLALAKSPTTTVNQVSLLQPFSRLLVDERQQGKKKEEET